MHMADALLSPAVGVGFYAASGGLLAYAARQVAREKDYERKAPLMGVLGAFIFAAQMINFSIPATGASGHIGGGLLLAALLGPWAALLATASVLTVQCLFFADGGLLALGCNIFNLGFWPAFVGWPLYRALTGKTPSNGRVTLASVLAAIAALEMGALGVVLETLLSGRSELPFSQFAALMLGIHLPIAVMEGFITAGVVILVRRLFAERFGETVSAPAMLQGGMKGIAVLAALALLTGAVLAWFASAHPDGLEWSIAKMTGQEELPAAKSGLAAGLQKAQETIAFLPDYGFPESVAAAETAQPAAESEPESGPWPAVSLGASVSGVVGAAITAAAVLLIGWLLRRWAGAAVEKRASA